MNEIQVQSDGSIVFDGKVIKKGFNLAIKDGVLYIEGMLSYMVADLETSEPIAIATSNFCIKGKENLLNWE